jgi:hypothetical protein
VASSGTSRSVSTEADATEADLEALRRRQRGEGERDAIPLPGGEHACCRRRLATTGGPSRWTPVRLDLGWIGEIRFELEFGEGDQPEGEEIAVRDDLPRGGGGIGRMLHGML